MRYIGGKSQLLTDIQAVIDTIPENLKTVMDIFAGTGVVSTHLKEKGYNVISNDFLYFSYVMQKCHIELNEKPDFSKMKNDPIEILNNIDISNPCYPIDKCFIYNNYSPANSDRMYFQKNNAIKIDLIRMTIEDWYNTNQIDEYGYFYLLTSLIEAVPYVANITGVYAAYLKFWDKRTFNPLVLQPPIIVRGSEKCLSLNYDYSEALKQKCDLLYADPPYNSREYLPNYHILETIARYDYPDIHGITGMRSYDKQKSDFSKKSKVAAAFEKLIKESNSKYILISYNNEGLLSTDELINICEKYAAPGTFRFSEFNYRQYKNKSANNTGNLKEQLYMLERIKNGDF